MSYLRVVTHADLADATRGQASASLWTTFRMRCCCRLLDCSTSTRGVFPPPTLRRHSFLLPPNSYRFFSGASSGPFCSALHCAAFQSRPVTAGACRCRRSTVPQLGKRWARLLRDAPADLWEDIDIDVDKELRGWPLNVAAVAAWLSARPVTSLSGVAP